MQLAAYLDQVYLLDLRQQQAETQMQLEEEEADQLEEQAQATLDQYLFLQETGESEAGAEEDLD